MIYQLQVFLFFGGNINYLLKYMLHVVPNLEKEHPLW